jgi:serine protease DegQ
MASSWYRRTAAMLCACALAAGCADDGDDPAGDRGSATTDATASNDTRADAAQDDDRDAVASFERIPDIVAALSPSVVAVTTPGGEGSGVILRRDGVAVTNAHVVGEATQAEVVFADATSAPAEVVATDPLTDVAVLRIERDEIPAAELAEGLPAVGELAIALGNPLGFENTATAGIISGLERAVPGAARVAPGLVDLIQTDAPISPGNSGGALVNAAGEVVGINVAYIPPTGGAVSIGFAIPAPTVASVVEDLLQDGEASHPFLGIRTHTITPELAQQYGLAREEAVLVLSVTPDGPAAQAGIEPGDIVVAAGGEPVRTIEDLLAAVRGLNPGDELELTVVADGSQRDVTVTLGERPSGP